MSIDNIKNAKAMQAEFKRLGRAGISQRALALIGECDGSYKDVMRLVGRFKALSYTVKHDDYWREQVNRGFEQELSNLQFFQPEDSPNE